MIPWLHSGIILKQKVTKDLQIIFTNWNFKKIAEKNKAKTVLKAIKNTDKQHIKWKTHVLIMLHLKYCGNNIDKPINLQGEQSGLFLIPFLNCFDYSNQFAFKFLIFVDNLSFVCVSGHCNFNCEHAYN